MSDKPLTGLEKVALLMKSLPADAVEKVLKHMDPKKAGRISSVLTEVAKRGDLQESLSHVLDEAVEILGHAKESVDSKRPTTSTVDLRIGGDGKGPESPIAPELAADADPLPALAKLDATVLAKALETENARTISVLMDRLDVDVAGQIYKRLSPGKRKEVSIRFTEQATLGEDLLRRIGHAVLRKCNAMIAVAPAAAPVENAREVRMAGLLRNLERQERLEMLAVLEQSDPALAARLKEMLYQFEDVLRMTNQSIQKLLSEIDMQTLATALRDGVDDIKARINANMSKRAQETLKEEIELTVNLPPVKIREARKAIEQALQRLDQREELAMIENG